MQNKRKIPVILNEKISDLVHDFMNFNVLKLFVKLIKKIKTDPGLILTEGNLLVAWYIYARYEKHPCNSE